MRKWLVFLILFLPLIPWLVTSGNYFYAANSQYSDLVVSHLPNAVTLMESLKTGGGVPLWSNLILGGAPFAADPLAGVWYPPGWIAFIFPLPFGFNLTTLLHILWGGIGMVWLLRRLNLRLEAAVLGGLAFELMPKLMAHMAAGHISLVYAVSWTPWLMLAELYRQDRKTSIALLLPGLVIGVIFLADPRWAVYAGLAWLIFNLWHSISSGKLRLSRKFVGWLGGIMLQLMIALGVGAVLILPLLEFTSLSTRSDLSSADILEFSLPSAHLLGLMFPNIGGYAEWVVYPGALVLLLSIIAIGRKTVRKKAAYWLVLALIGLVISLGSLWPGSELAVRLPLVNLLRVPSRAWFLTAMALTGLAAYGFDSLLNFHANHENKGLKLVLTAITALGVLIALGLVVLSGGVPIGFIWGGAVILAGYGLLLKMLNGQEYSSWVAMGLIALVVADLGGVNILGIDFRSKCEVNGEGTNAALFLINQEGKFRVYSPSYSIPQHTAAQLGLELVDGVNPMQLRSTSEFMEQASGVPNDGYSVTVPAFTTGDPKVDNAKAIPNTELLGIFNVKYVAAEFEIQQDRLVEVWQAGTTHVYENLDFKPRVWVQEMGTEPGQGIQTAGVITHLSSDRLTAEVEGPGLVVLSIPDYPGWGLKVDGVKTDILRIAKIFIGVEVGEGRHEVDLTFQSELLTLGQGISVTVWLLILGFALVKTRCNRKGSAN